MARPVVRILMGIAFLAIASFILWIGVLGLLGYVPGVGTSGSLSVTRCAPVGRGGVDCVGVFTDRAGKTRSVTAEGVSRAGVVVEAKLLPWSGNRAFARRGVRSLLGMVGTTLFGGAVFGIGAGAVVGGVRSRHRGTPTGLS